jgi:adenylate cyclase
MGQGLARARTVKHPFTQAFASCMAACLSHYLREPGETLRHAEGALGIATEQGFGQWIPFSLILRGWALAEQGRPGEGLEGIRKGVEAFRRTGAQLMRPYFLSMLAEACAKDGQTDAGLAALDEAMAMADRTRDIHWTPELHRLRGTLLTTGASRDVEAEQAFRAAEDAARRLGAPLLELRAAASLSRLWQRQRRLPEAHDRLSRVFEPFTEGFETVDLRYARALLAELSA